MLRHGIPPDVVTALRAVSRSFARLGRLGDRDPAGSRTAGRWSSPAARCEVLHRPGHSPSDTVFWDAERAILLAGDHLIKHISSNPLISRPLGGRSGEPGDERPRALLMYMTSLRETREMPLVRVAARPRREFDGHARLIDDRFALHERRARRSAAWSGTRR